jgi:hypothetical protein
MKDYETSLGRNATDIPWNGTVYNILSAPVLFCESYILLIFLPLSTFFKDRHLLSFGKDDRHYKSRVVFATITVLERVEGHCLVSRHRGQRKNKETLARSPSEKPRYIIIIIIIIIGMPIICHSWRKGKETKTYGNG